MSAMGSGLDFAAHSDPYIRDAFWAGVVTCALACLILLSVMTLRLATAWRQRRKQEVIEVWRPLIAIFLAGERPPLPSLPAASLVDFLYLWLHFHESLRGGSKAMLNDMLSALGLLKPICKLLQRGRMQEKLLAATALGHAHCGEAWSELVSLARAAEPALSIVAARALMKINATAAADIVIPLIIERRDWSPATVALMLNEVEPAFVDQFLQTVAASLQQPYLVRLLHLIEAMGLNRRLPFLRRLLQDSRDAEAVSACLRLIHDPNDLDLVRMRLHDPDWRVRVQVANTLGRLGGPEDLPGLRALLAAPEWWVRYRAAQAMAALPFMQPAMLVQIAQDLGDPYARDMLRQVMSEKEAA